VLWEKQAILTMTKKIGGFQISLNSPTWYIVRHALCPNSAGLSQVYRTKLKFIFEILTESGQL
jgi:hypothetical protein